MKYTRKTMHFGAPPGIYARARDLRNNRTKAELLLWEHLRDRKMEGVKFRQQHPLLRYVVDFYAHEIKLVIEVDGDIHLDKIEMINDRIKSEDLLANDLHLIRFTNNEVIHKTEFVLQALRNKILELRNRKQGSKSLPM